MWQNTSRETASRERNWETQQGKGNTCESQTPHPSQSPENLYHATFYFSINGERFIIAGLDVARDGKVMRYKTYVVDGEVYQRRQKKM